MGNTRLLCLLGILLAARADAEPLLLHSFEEEAGLAALKANNVKLSLSAEHATAGAKALRINYAATDWPNVTLKAGEGYTVTDWRPYGVFLFDAYNPEEQPLKVSLRIDDDQKADGAQHCRQSGVEIPPKKRVTVAMRIQGGGDGFMRGAPPVATGDVQGDLGNREMDVGRVVAFQLFLAKPKEAHTLYVDNLRLAPAPPLKGIVDRFGQYTGADWPGKIHGEADLQAQGEAEARLLKAAPRPADRDEWGGWAKGPKLQATGWFRAEKVGGKWWLVTPAGHLFWSAGLDCVRPDNWGPTKGREEYFTWLPAEGDPLFPFARGGANFYGMNLQRKYGAEWLEPWLNVTRERMAAWGFNTVANWSDDRSYARLKVPYTVPIHYGGAPGFPGGWRDIPDFYTGKWEKAVEGAIKSITDKWREDPYCIGYFVDNELSWGSWGANQYALPVNALGLPGDRAVKQAFANLLQAKYGDVGKLNAAWGTAIASWEAFRADPVTLPKERNEALRADLDLLLSDFAKRYFTVVSRLMKQYAPKQLYLGPRFAVAPDAVVMASREYCDVVSYNIYGLPPQNLLEKGKQIAKLDKPVVIGEFHFGALDRGMFHGGLGQVASQEARGEAYATYVRTALAQPWCVGAHWFIYADQSLTGRFDGENYNIGFVSGTDTPYPELIERAKEVNLAVYELRGK